ncbi:bacteriocin immunity protein [Superficieibacter sp.]|uniref:bacteriocin immunity protein n=1 Tax=Superficieibacter sp. TaxID=2303322 RepID=UPI0028AA9FB3|nr:bacteriocin immunity protein [Superficieibacter sp.]
MVKFRNKIEDYTEAEFIELIQELENAPTREPSLKGKKLVKYIDDIVDHFIKITEHPAQGDLLFYPKMRGDEEPENVVKIVREWRRAQGLPLFKDSK